MKCRIPDRPVGFLKDTGRMIQTCASDISLAKPSVPARRCREPLFLLLIVCVTGLTLQPSEIGKCLGGLLLLRKPRSIDCTHLAHHSSACAICCLSRENEHSILTAISSKCFPQTGSFRNSVVAFTFGDRGSMKTTGSMKTRHSDGGRSTA